MIVQPENTPDIFSLGIYVRATLGDLWLFVPRVYVSSRETCIDTSCDSGTSTLETFYSNFIARQL